MTQHWLMKSEPAECSIDDLFNAAAQTVAWVGVRSYQARNFMRDAMRIGDDVLFYHSSCAEPGIAGLAKVASGAYPDATQWNVDSPYYDAKVVRDEVRWLNVDVRLVRKTRLLALQEMRANPALATMQVLRPANRLSITPVSDEEWLAVNHLLANKG
jgi:predicted RNA-binding protein with PUA-like domain